MDSLMSLLPFILSLFSFFLPSPPLSPLSRDLALLPLLSLFPSPLPLPRAKKKKRPLALAA